MAGNRDNPTFENLFFQLKEFINLNKRFPFKEEHKKLSIWLNQIRYRKEKGLISTEEINELDALGIIWDKALAYREEKFLRSFIADFIELQHFLSTYNRFPKREDNGSLYERIAKYRRLKKRKALPLFVEQKLDETGFLRDKQKNKWQEKYNAVLGFVQRGKMEALRSNYELNNWLRRQLLRFEHKMLEDDKMLAIEQIYALINHLAHVRIIFNEALPKIVFIKEPKLSVTQIKEAQNLSKLSDFIATRHHWPKVDSCDPTEKKLGNWCQYLRWRYKRNMLGNELFSALQSINFNFEGRGDYWQEKMDILQSYIDTNHHLPEPEDPLFIWGKGQLKKIRHLSEEQQKKLKQSSFMRLYSLHKKDVWTEQFEQLVKFKAQNTKVPTPKTNLQLYNWLRTQRKGYINGKLEKEKIAQLKALGVQLTPTVDYEKQWYKLYQDLIDFRKKNPNRWPNYFNGGKERKLNIWCQMQRRVVKHHTNIHKPDIKTRIEKLKEINFHFSGNELKELYWEKMLEKTKSYIENNKSKPIPSYIEGKAFDVYKWIKIQKQSNAEGNLEPKKIKKLQALNLI